jgi:hypothetical protein
MAYISESKIVEKIKRKGNVKYIMGIGKGDGQGLMAYIAH